MSAPGTLDQLAGWDPAELRGGVGRLADVADRLLPWRTRLDALGRRLGGAGCWSGPAGETAAAALVTLSSATAVVCGALATSLSGLQRLTAAAGDAQQDAAAALAIAGSAGVALDGQGVLTGVPGPPVATMAPDQAAAVLAVRQDAQVAAARAADALHAAARALACAQDAGQPLTALGSAGAGPVDVDGLVARLRVPAQLPTAQLPTAQLPTAQLEPADVAAWWNGLPAAQQLALIAGRPAAIGALDGLPGWARDRANRRRLAGALLDLRAGEQRAMAVAVADQLARAGPDVQLLQFDPPAGLVAIAVGDVDTASAVGVLVPGINTTPDDDLPGLLRDAAAVAAAARAAAPGLAVATVAWLGYRTPGLATSVLRQASERGGAALDRALDGLAAARSGPGAPPAPRTTVVAHSYGTVVAGQAVRAPGRLAADALVLLGSPGLVGRRADRLEVAEVHGAAAPADPVAWVDWFGRSPSDSAFGDLPLPTEPTQGHTQYYDADRPTLAAIGEVVAGTRPRP